MLDFHEKRKIKSVLYSWPSIIFLAVLAVFLSTAVYERFSREREMAAKRDALASELETLEGRAASLQAEVDRLQSERGIEEEIRDRYEVSKRGEEVVVLIGDDVEKGTATKTIPAAVAEEKHWYDIFWR
jgi:cell division protein FtsB